MSNKLFVGGLAWATSDASLRAAFEPYGEVVDAKVITDRETGRSRGFGFVTYREASAAADAIAKMDGAAVDGRNVRVNEAQERARRGPGGPPPGERRGYGGPPSGGRDRGGDRSYPPVERSRSYGGPPPGPPMPGEFGEEGGKPAGRKRHNGGGKRRGRDEPEGGGRGGGGGRRGGGRDEHSDW